MSQIRNKMTVETPSDLEIVLTRELNAPRSLVFEAWTKPEHVTRWWGAHCTSMHLCEIDLRVGGSYRYETKGPDDNVHPFKGVYREVLPPEKLVHTMIYDVEPYNQFEAVVTVLFEDLDGRTKVIEKILHQTKEARDGHLFSGMEEGAVVSFNQLEDLLDEMQEGAA